MLLSGRADRYLNRRFIECKTQESFVGSEVSTMEEPPIIILGRVYRSAMGSLCTSESLTGHRGPSSNDFPANHRVMREGGLAHGIRVRLDSFLDREQAAD